MMRKKVLTGWFQIRRGINLPLFWAYYNSGGEKQGGKWHMSDFMAVVPLFCKDLRASLYKPFFIKFYPLFYSPGALFGNFGLVAISLILFIHAVSFAYSFSLFYQTCTFVIFFFLNSLFPLNKAFFVYDGFSLLFSFLFKPSAYIELSCRHSPKRLFLWLRWGEIYRKNKPSLLIKLYPKNSPLYKFPPLSNN